MKIKHKTVIHFVFAILFAITLLGGCAGITPTKPSGEKKTDQAPSSPFTKGKIYLSIAGASQGGTSYIQAGGRR